MQKRDVVLLSSLMSLFCLGMLYAEPASPIKVASGGGAIFDGSKPECAMLRGTARIHCEIGSDPHLGPMPVVVDTVRPGSSNDEAIRTLERSISRLDDDIAYYREELQRPSSDDDPMGRRGATDLTIRQRQILETLTRLQDQRAALVRELAAKQQPKSSQGQRLPADYDCTKDRGRSLPQAEKAVPAKPEPEESQPKSGSGGRLPADHDCTEHK